MLVNYIKKRWPWVLCVIVVLLVGLIISWTPALQAGLAAIVWFATNQVLDIRKKRKHIAEKTEAVSEDLEEEATRQDSADAQIKETAQEARESVNDTWDVESTRDTPGLD